VKNMKIEQDSQELETVAILKQGQFRFVDDAGDVGYFIAEIREWLFDSERELLDVVDIWWESMTREEKWLPKEEWIKEYWNSYYHTV